MVTSFGCPGPGLSEKKKKKQAQEKTNTGVSHIVARTEAVNLIDIEKTKLSCTTRTIKVCQPSSTSSCTPGCIAPSSAALSVTQRTPKHDALSPQPPRQYHTAWQKHYTEVQPPRKRSKCDSTSTTELPQYSTAVTDAPICHVQPSGSTGLNKLPCGGRGGGGGVHEASGAVGQHINNAAQVREEGETKRRKYQSCNNRGASGVWSNPSMIDRAPVLRAPRISRQNFFPSTTIEGGGGSWWSEPRQVGTGRILPACIVHGSRALSTNGWTTFHNRARC